MALAVPARFSGDRSLGIGWNRSGRYSGGRYFT